MNLVAPSLLSADFMNLEKEIKEIENAGADILHLDIMDGHFVPNLTFGFPIIEKIRKISNIPLDIHFMVKNPEDYVNACRDLKIEYVSFHLEGTIHTHRMIYAFKENNIKTGIAINPATPVTFLEPVLSDLDFVLLMSVNPGFGGQAFIPYVYSKVYYLSNLRKKDNLDLQIEVDGGVNSEIAKELVLRGADILVAGSYVFKSSNYKDSIRSLKICSEI